MDTTIPSLGHLFEQLGLESSELAIETFIGKHALAQGEYIYEAHFWTPSQQSFLAEAISSDGHWSELVDQLANLLQG
ncbi:MAG: DUF2789 family protein [Shewanella sp.]|uniref:DUF2789 family protein n=1 Tax=Shewanella sp. SNU WT4 TaxID=2590015 RepID=UPI0011281A2C|nr:DUF2789 family protein [Shewanella sp. SNU WT4]QDF67781.1 DUF2789 domain-containing protein [Shewanella sp. SNU WT4]